jgi:dTDP-4-amino-4,6-dideoxygalactose transaminase
VGHGPVTLGIQARNIAQQPKTLAAMASGKNSDIDPEDFTRFEPVPPAGIERAVALMRSGKLFRYSDNQPEDCEAALLERDVAEYVGVRFALAVNSCTKAIELALIACGVEPGSQVLVPGFTFTAVPSAVVILRAVPVFVETNWNYRLDIDDLRRRLTPETKVLLLSHMRGHISDMDAIEQLCAEHNITLIEDAAHALGARWRERKIGSIGKVGCFSFQSNKLINAGEGGVLVTDDEDIIVKAICLSGAYEGNYRKHFVRSKRFADTVGTVPQHNARMSNLTAAVARPQINLLEDKLRRYQEIYRYLKQALAETNRIEFPEEYPQETRIPDSIQFRIIGYNAPQLQSFVERVRATGVPLAGFWEANNARAFYNWRYLRDDMPDLPQTRQSLASACDMRLPSNLGDAHFGYIISAIQSALRETEGND